MPEVSGYVPGPYLGVSQVAPQLRLNGACAAMEDCAAFLPLGCQKRPPVEFKKKLLSSNGASSAGWYEIPRGSDASDLALLINYEGGHTVPRLFKTSDWSSVSITIDSAAQTYLDANAPNPNRDLRVLPIEDTVFITNRTVKAANGGATAAAHPQEAIIWIRKGEYSRNYEVLLHDTAFGTIRSTYETNNGAAASDAEGIGTDRVAKGLYDGTIPTGSGATWSGTTLASLTGNGYTVILDGSVIYLSHPTHTFDISVTDDQGGDGAVAIKDSVQRFSDLPAYAHDGFTVKVAQAAAGGNSDYYVKFIAKAGHTGIWQECIQPGAPLGVANTTMPVTLLWNGSSWHLTLGAWTQRTVGDASLVPDPQFIGDYIYDLTWWKGRLGLVSGNTPVVYSASDNPYKFYTTTLAAALDSDPIALANPSKRTTTFKTALDFDLREFVLGDKVQAIVSTAQGMASPSATRIDTLSESEFSDQVPPQPSNHKIYFAAFRTSYASIFEMSIDRLSGLALPDLMTKAVPAYIPNTIDRAASLRTDYVTLYGTSGATQIYVNAYVHDEQQRVQNSWFRWNLRTGYSLAGVFFKNATAYMLLLQGANMVACTMDLSPRHLDPSSSKILTYLDMRCSEADASSITYSGGNTTFTLPVTVAADVAASVRAPASGSIEGFRPTVVSTTSTTVTLQGDWRTVPLWFGYVYTSSFTPSKWYFYGPDGKPQHTGKLNIRRLRVDVAALSYLRVEVSIRGGASRATTYEGIFTDDVETPLDAAPSKASTFLRVTVKSDAENVSVRFVNDSHLGFELAGYEWWGEWTPQAQRVGAPTA